MAKKIRSVEDLQAIRKEAQAQVDLRSGRKDMRITVHMGTCGIADTGLAMTEGYSTAGRQARRLGFGAGMGLPNIRKSVDRFTLESTVGKGTRLCFTIYLKPQTGREARI